MAKHERRGGFFSASVDPTEYDKAKAEKMEQERLATEEKLEECIKYVKQLEKALVEKDEKIKRLEHSLLSAATTLRWED